MVTSLKQADISDITQVFWDIIVVGGGPAGMMAAGRAAEAAAAKNTDDGKTGQKIKILLIEKNASLGKKLLITGGGRCNVTNAEFDDRALLEKFKGDGKFLFSAFSQYSVKETLDFFNSRGMETKVEAAKRVFPVSNKAQSVWDTLVGYMKDKNNVTILSNSEVAGFIKDENKNEIVAVTLKNGANKSKSKDGQDGKSKNIEIRGKRFILATGGKSHPETGSTGEGFAWLSALGHNVIEPSASLVPVKIRDEWVKKLAGVTLPDVRISLFNEQNEKIGQNSNNKRSKENKKGKILFTHFGVSGPTILNMSRDIGELLEYGEYDTREGKETGSSGLQISLDLLPSHDYATLNTALQELFKKDHLKKIKNALARSGGNDGNGHVESGGAEGLIMSALVPVVLEQAGRWDKNSKKINPDTPCNSITREERIALVSSLKDLRMNVEGLLGADKAIVTSGGVALDEVDFKTMQSRLIANLYLVGDVLNIDRPSGGYSLQLCWTTGWVAGTNASA